MQRKIPQSWRNTTLEERHRIMFEAANRLGGMRGDLIGSMCAITGKTVVEGDVEVSEGIDYARFYTTTMKKFAALHDVDITSKGTILVISPWNFPCAIPIGGIVAGLAGGNTVILKPATVAAPVAWLFAKAFWDAGVPKEALQVIITDREALKELTTAPVIKSYHPDRRYGYSPKHCTYQPVYPTFCRNRWKKCYYPHSLGRP